ncbi:hypothetical protein BS78_07G189700 [Paspalum vaginatum]|nr:hypothetical protein BS78_07G189700 [Paspalum vaginatum]KAJ1269166.1 hypothetical protein BS78_07G189700 [Paspalum vaginatum]KAJ1269167.1 hypothetical protein BS78_07G189700 [Paspalum vaginatum]
MDCTTLLADRHVFDYIFEYLRLHSFLNRVEASTSAMYSEDEQLGSSPESVSESEPEPPPLLVSAPAPAHQRPLLLNPAYARCKSVIHDELRSFRVFLQWCALDHSTRAGRAVSYAAFLALALAVPAAVSLSLRADAALSPASASAITFNRVAQVPATGLAAISFLTLAAFFRRLGSLRQLLFLDGALRDDTAFVRRGYARELDRAFRLLAALLLPSLCVEAAHKAVFFFCTVRVEPPVASPFLPLLLPPVPWRAVALVATVVSWVYRTGVFLLVCVLFRLTCELQILRFEGIYHMFDVEARATAAEIFAEHRRIRTQLFATSHRYRVFILCCLVTITVSQLGALVVALSSRAPKSFSNTGDLLVGSAVQLSGFFMCLVGAARITHRAQRIVSIASQWHMRMVAMHHGKYSPPSTSVGDADASRVSGSSTAVSQAEADPGAPCSYRSRQALVTYLRHNGGGITLFGFTLDRGLLHTIFVFEMTLVLWILSKVVVL